MTNNMKSTVSLETAIKTLNDFVKLPDNGKIFIEGVMQGIMLCLESPPPNKTA